MADGLTHWEARGNKYGGRQGQYHSTGKCNKDGDDSVKEYFGPEAKTRTETQLTKQIRPHRKGRLRPAVEARGHGSGNEVEFI